MKILFILDFFPPHIGGVETLFDILTNKLAEKGFDVTIYTSLVRGSKKFEINNKRKIYRVKVCNRYFFVSPSKLLYKLIKNTDIIHTTSFIATGTTFVGNIFFNKPVIATFHEIWDKLFFDFQNFFSASINWVLENLMCKIYKNSFKLTCPSNYTKKMMIKKGIPENKIEVIYHGIDHELFNPKVEPFFEFDFPTYLYFGRPGISKGLPYLLESVNLISKEIPESKLLLMISRKDKRELLATVRLIKKNRVEKNVILLKPRKNYTEVPKVIKSANISVIPSFSEGFCFAAVESQACGIPVVASMAGSLPEVVRGGLFIRPGDPKDIANKIILLLQDDKLRNKLSRRGIKFSKRFT